MITFRLIDGTEYVIKQGHENEVVQRIRSEMMTDPGSNQKYMEAISNLVADMFGFWINTQDEKAFLEALVDLKILDRIK